MSLLCKSPGVERTLEGEVGRECLNYVTFTLNGMASGQMEKHVTSSALLCSCHHHLLKTNILAAAKHFRRCTLENGRQGIDIHSLNKHLLSPVRVRQNDGIAEMESPTSLGGTSACWRQQTVNRSVKSSLVGCHRLER